MFCQKTFDDLLSLSKRLSLESWRIGVTLIPKGVRGLFEAMCNVASHTYSFAPAPIQHAALLAYNNDEDIERRIEAARWIHREVMTWMWRRLTAAGLQCDQPQGGFYIYPSFCGFKDALLSYNYGRGIHTSNELQECLLQDYGVATLPGTVFGDSEDNLTLRLAGSDYGREPDCENGALTLCESKLYPRNRNNSHPLYNDKLPDKEADDFIHKACPNIVEAVKRVELFLAHLCGQEMYRCSPFSPSTSRSAE